MTSIIVTGANGGIGKATSRLLQKLGNNLILVDYQFDESFRSEFDKSTSNRIYEVDIRSLGEIEDLFSKLIAQELEVKGVVHLAGITRDRTLLKMTEREWQEVIDVNLTGSYRILQLGAKLLKDNGGSIIMTGSTAAKFGNYGQINYVASKAGVEGMTKTAARELAKFKIRVNCVIPGYIETPMTEQIPSNQREKIIQQIPLKRTGKPEDVAKVIGFLLSKDSDYITGQAIQVDGGLRI